MSNTSTTTAASIAFKTRATLSNSSSSNSRRLSRQKQVSLDDDLQQQQQHQKHQKQQYDLLSEELVKTFEIVKSSKIGQLPKLNKNKSKNAANGLAKEQNQRLNKSVHNIHTSTRLDEPILLNNVRLLIKRKNIL
jgi:hypothetical protein